MDEEMTVGKLVELLTTFSPDSLVSLTCNFMQDAALTVHPSDGTGSVDIWEN